MRITSSALVRFPSFSNLLFREILSAEIEDDALFLKIIERNLTAFTSLGVLASSNRAAKYSFSKSLITRSALVNGMSIVSLFLGGKTVFPSMSFTSSLTFLDQR